MKKIRAIKCVDWTGPSRAYHHVCFVLYLCPLYSLRGKPATSHYFTQIRRVLSVEENRDGWMEGGEMEGDK